MIGRLALRSLTAHPVRSAVLAAGFGVGVAVMAILLGVAQVVLVQAQSPQLFGGGDVVIRLADQVPVRLLLSGTLQSDALRERVRVASPFQTTNVFLLHNGKSTRVTARGGIPSLERQVGDAETSRATGWHDSDADRAWRQQPPDRLLRQIDRFHPIPDAPEWADSWAEWLYFNGRSGSTRFYLTFLAGPRVADGRRVAGVRLQLERNGRMETFSASSEVIDEALSRAPDITVGDSSVRLDGMRYRIHLDLRDAGGRRVTGDVSLQATPGRLVPPLEVSGARGWVTGYVVPVMSGALEGRLDVDGSRITLDGSGYHDHNWGFWRGVSWQWGQVQHDDLSFIYGRVFPPREAADPERMPGFLGVLGPDGPLGYATNVTITESNDSAGKPAAITVHGRGPSIDITMKVDVLSSVTTHMAQAPLATGIDFLQLRGQYTVHGRAGTREIDFTAPGAAETFRGQSQVSGSTRLRTVGLQATDPGLMQ